MKRLFSTCSHCAEEEFWMHSIVSWLLFRPLFSHVFYISSLYFLIVYFSIMIKMYFFMFILIELYLKSIFVFLSTFYHLIKYYTGKSKAKRKIKVNATNNKQK